MNSIQDRYAQYVPRLAQQGQSHLLAFWPQLDDAQRGQLLDDLDQIDFERCLPLVPEYVLNRPKISLPEKIEPASVWPAEPDAARAETYRRAVAAGEAAIRAGQVAAFTVAGGQGTRLGYDGPKGGFPISPIRNVCLFQWFAESLRGVERRYGRRPRWYIMTSPLNHAQTLEIFRKHAWFGLREDDVMFFQQGQMPAFTPDGKIALSERHRVSLSPDGHGGSLQALADSGALADMRRRGVEIISYFQVDNPLVKTIDPLFVGLHLTTGSEMSSKAVTKVHDLERVGNFCLADGQLMVIEYSDIPEALAKAKSPDGARRFDAGSIAIHLLSRAFVERLTAGGGCRLPWHRADKSVAVVGADGQITTPKTPNVVKLEMFVFDAIPLARNPLVLYVRREEEFSPVKNAEGADSPATTRRDLVRQAARWLETCGVAVPRGAAGEPDLLLEISPAYALDVADLREKLKQPPMLERGRAFLLS